MLKSNKLLRIKLAREPNYQFIDIDRVISLKDIRGEEGELETCIELDMGDYVQTIYAKGPADIINMNINILRKVCECENINNSRKIV